MQRGFFVSFEGTEGCGKSTQICLLRDHLVSCGREVVLTREPGGTAAGEEIRNLLQFSPQGNGLVPEAELLLFTASRAQLVREVIQPALHRGAVVLSDRFLDSTSVYQGIARRIPRDAVAFINGFAVAGCLPDLTIVLDLDPADAQNRLSARDSGGAKPDRMEQEPLSFYTAVRKAYLELAECDPVRFRVLDASETVEKTAAQVAAFVKEKQYGLR